MGKNLKSVCVCEIESLCCTPETQHCKSTIYTFFFFFKKKSHFTLQSSHTEKVIL